MGSVMALDRRTALRHSLQPRRSETQVTNEAAGRTGVGDAGQPAPRVPRGHATRRTMAPPAAKGGPISQLAASSVSASRGQTQGVREFGM